MAASCRSISRSPMIRPSSTGRGRTRVPNIVRRPASAEQARIAKAYITQLNDTHVFGAPIVTVIEPGRTFFPAEGYHQDFLTRNPTYPYIAINDLPKIEALKRLFPDSYRVEPVLVATAGSSN